VFTLILSSIVHLKEGALRLIALVIPLICISNFISIWIAYGAGLIILEQASLSLLTNMAERSLEPLWLIGLPGWIPTKYAMVLAVIFGLLSSRFFPAQGQKVSTILNKITAIILTKIVIPFLPMMILGFVIKMKYDDILEELMSNYAFIFLAASIVQIIYVFGLYIVVNKFKTSIWLNNLKNMVPPFITAFSTMSSAATMPLTLIATRKNVHDPDVVNFVIPSTVNFHLIGDLLAMPIISLAIMSSYGYSLPGMWDYFIFSLYYVVARFSVAAIPGGGVFVLWGLLESQFHFTADMLGLVQTLNLAFEPMITGFNVLGNGIFAILFAKIYHRWTGKVHEAIPQPV
jgi:Na+/H+-dicarboxylate symporter